MLYCWITLITLEFKSYVKKENSEEIQWKYALKRLHSTFNEPMKRLYGIFNLLIHMDGLDYFLNFSLNLRRNGKLWLTQAEPTGATHFKNWTDDRAYDQDFYLFKTTDSSSLFYIFIVSIKHFILLSKKKVRSWTTVNKTMLR